jgi:LCP family protein required for cell wall assembly
MGVDMPGTRGGNPFEGVRTDTMMLTRLDPPNRRINIISIPRDSHLKIAGSGYDKINAAFALGGTDLAVKSIEQNLNVTVDHYVVINTHGIRDVVDALGGIDIYVDKPMRYHDFSAKLHIDLKPGWNHLDGKVAEGYLRFRHDAHGDIGRIRRQQNFIAAVTKKLKDPVTWLNFQQIFEVGRKYILTDLSEPELIAMTVFGKDIKPSAYRVATVPGRSGGSGGVSYWEVDQYSMDKIVKRLMYDTYTVDSPNTVTGPIKVGLLYTTSHKDDIEHLQSILAQDEMSITCKSQTRNRNTQIIVNSMAVNEDSIERLRKLFPEFGNLQLIFSPPGSTFETTSCGETDFTIVLGENTRSFNTQ